MQTQVSLGAVFAAEKIVYSALKPTQLTPYQNLSELIGCQVYIKHENQHPGGSFKIRGGVNLMHHLREEGVRGVITFSTGNHGIIAVRLRVKKKVQNLNAMWYKEFAKNFATQGDFGHESP